MNSSPGSRSSGNMNTCSILALGTVLMTAFVAPSRAAASELASALSQDDAWARFPEVEAGQGEPLPVWARMLAGTLPRTTAAFWNLITPSARRARSTPSSARPCAGSPPTPTAASTPRPTRRPTPAAAGLDDAAARALGARAIPGWSDADRAALEFARKMTVDSDSVTDDEFAALVEHFGERQAASMVLLLAYANFQDRLLLCLGADVGAGRAARLRLEVALRPGARSPSQTTPPPPRSKSTAAAALGQGPRRRLGRLGRRSPTTRCRTGWRPSGASRRGCASPVGRVAARTCPRGCSSGPSDIVWYRIVFGYAPELAVPYEYFMRTAGAEARPSGTGSSARACSGCHDAPIKCPYCMGHCEMNWEVAGLTQGRDRRAEPRCWPATTGRASRPAEQHAFAFARKLTHAPWASLGRRHRGRCKQDFGPDRALIVTLNACRYHYMTRHLQRLPADTGARERVLRLLQRQAPGGRGRDLRDRRPAVPVLSDAECWKRLPRQPTGGGQPLPNWAKAVAVHLPRTAAAMLELDLRPADARARSTRTPRQDALGRSPTPTAATTPRRTPWPTCSAPAPTTLTSRR